MMAFFHKVFFFKIIISQMSSIGRQENFSVYFLGFVGNFKMIRFQYCTRFQASLKDMFL